jgi:hypothetical protein
MIQKVIPVNKVSFGNWSGVFLVNRAKKWIGFIVPFERILPFFGSYFWHSDFFLIPLIYALFKLFSRANRSVTGMLDFCFRICYTSLLFLRLQISNPYAASARGKYQYIWRCHQWQNPRK